MKGPQNGWENNNLLIALTSSKFNISFGFTNVIDSKKQYKTFHVMLQCYLSKYCLYPSLLKFNITRSNSASCFNVNIISFFPI